MNLKLLTGASVSFFGFCLGLSYWEVSTDEEFLNSTSLETTVSILAQTLLSSKIRILSVLNISFCFLLLLGKLVQIIFFGNLRTEESRVKKIHHSS